MGDITCLFFVPMSTIDDSWLYFVPHPVARGRCARMQPSGGALIGCARNRKSFRHMDSGVRIEKPPLTTDDKVGKDTRDARESSPQPGRKLRGGKVTGRRETGRKETGRKGTGGKTTGVKERGVGETGGKEKGVGETGGKTTAVKERGVGETRAKEWEVGETGTKETGGKGSGQNVMEGIERKSYSAAVIERVRKRARVFVGDSILGRPTES